MKKSSIVILSVFNLLVSSCNNVIKNEKAQVTTEEGTEIKTTTENAATTNSTCHECGFWVGLFNEDALEDDRKYLDSEAILWERENKINISIDKIEGDKVIGHSVVAGNDRPFHGTITQENNTKTYVVNEPGDDKYDGIFTFQIQGDSLLVGKWRAYNSKLEISKRKYELAKKQFNYDPNIALQNTSRYINWTKSKANSSEFETSTDKIFEINASNTLLTEQDIKKLSKGDLYVIRNAIYARHGYSFKKRPLRVFFDAQDWYIPVYNDIRNDFTEVEKQNIALLLKAEKHAKTYYDYFGR